MLKWFVGILMALTVPAAAETLITVDTQAVGDNIPQELWGNNFAWCNMSVIYRDHGGLPDSLFQDIQAMGLPSTRYPGGCYSDTFHWEDAIGPIEERKVQWLNGCKPPAYPAYKAHFGVDDFMHLCERLGAEPQITLQFRMNDSVWPIEAEQSLSPPQSQPADTQPTATQPAGVKVLNKTDGSGQYLLLEHKGDTCTLKFHAPRDGHYKLHIIGDGLNPSIETKAITGHGEKKPQPIALNADNQAGDWITYSSPLHFFRFGEQEINLTAAADGARVDLLKLEEFNQDQSIKRAQAWVAYCNGHPDDVRTIGIDDTGKDWKTVGYWAQLRGRKDYGDHPEPYAVKFWEVGNEAWGVDPYGSTTGQDPKLYVEAWKKYNQAISAIDPTLRLSLCSNTPDSQGGPNQWPEVVIKELGDQANFLHYHPYYPWDKVSKEHKRLYLNGVFASVGWQTSLDMYRHHINQYHPDRLDKLKISASEWAAAYSWWGPNIDWATRWTGAMMVADTMGTMTGNLDLMENAQYWLLLYGNVCVFNRGKGPNAPDGFFKTTLYEVFRHFNHYFGDRVIEVNCDDVPTHAFEGWGTAIPAGDYPLITAYASKDSRGWYALLVNKIWDQPHDVRLQWLGLPDGVHQVTVRTIQAGEALPNWADINTAEKNIVRTTEACVKLTAGNLDISLPPCSLTWLEISRGPSATWSRTRAVGDLFTIYRDVEPYGNIQFVYEQDDAVARLGNPGDEIVIPFNVPEDGHYEIAISVSTTPEDFRCHLDGKQVEITPDQPNRGLLKDQNLTAGRHYLRMKAHMPGLAVHELTLRRQIP